MVVATQAGGTGAALVAENVLRYGSAIFAARALGDSGFGVYTLAFTIVAFVQIIGTLGLSPGVLPFLHEALDQGSERAVRAIIRITLGLAFTVSSVLAVVIFVLADELAVTVFGEPALGSALRLFAGVSVLGALNGACRPLLQGLGAVARQQWLERVLNGAVSCGTLAVVWAFGLGMGGAAAAAYLGMGSALAATLLFLRQRLPQASFSGSAASQVPAGLRSSILSKSWPLMGTTMLGFTLLWSDVLLMGYFQDSEDVGVYGAGARLAAAGIAAQEALGPILLTLAAGLFVRGEREELARVYHLTVRWAIWPGFVVVAILFVWAEQWLGVFGPEFAAGATPMRVLLLGKAVAILTGMPGRMYSVTGLQKYQLLNMLLLVTGNIALNCLWIPRHGMVGAAAATALSLSSIRVLQTVQLRILRGVLPWEARTLLPMAAMFPLAGMAWFLRGAGEHLLAGWGWLLGCALFAGACAGVFLVWGLHDEDRELWASLRSRRAS